MNIIFMGTPEFSVPSLNILLESDHHVVGVVTAPDKPAGRGLKLSKSAVKKRVQSLDLDLLQPQKLRDTSFLNWLCQKNADLYVVVAFRILPPEVFEIPPKGTINLHASLLPKYRGAAPINWAIIKGEKKTGLTTFFIDRNVDTGNIIFQRSVAIGAEERAGELHDRLAVLGAELILDTVNAIDAGTAPRIAQKGEATAAPKINREMCEINWNDDATAVHNLIRGLSPYPGAFTTLNGRITKIYRATLKRKSGVRKEPGQITRIEKDSIQVQTGDGFVAIKELQPEGRRRMSAEDFLRGHALSGADRFGT